MSWEICGLSALQIHRTPPQAKLLLPSIPPLEIRTNRKELSNSAPYREIFHSSVNVLVDRHGLRNGSRNVAAHLWQSSYPSQAFWHDDELDADYTSPLFTLLTLAPTISVFHLAMASFELCGSFAVYRPSKEMQTQLDRLERQRLMWPGGWKQVKDYRGEPTSLWKRDPLIEIHELHRFVEETKGMRGNRKLAQAAQMVTGICASPLEVQASMLLGLSRRMGGEGLGPFINNLRIPLSSSARKLAGQNACYADMFFEANHRHGDIDIELQGHMIHDGGPAGGVDANRTLALQSMGIDVILLTSEQLSNASRFHETATYLAQKLGIVRKPKTAAMIKREGELRADLFIDWETLGQPSARRTARRSSR